VERDVKAHAGARVIVPAEVPEADASVVTGEGFRLRWPAAG